MHLVRRLLCISFIGLNITHADDPQRIEVAASVSGSATLTVRNGQKTAPLMGRFERLDDRVIFHPALPLPGGQRYRFEWQEPGGDLNHVEFVVPAPDRAIPMVRMEPTGVPFPANALKFYLHFSEPMEQGVFLERLHLLGGNGTEIAGPFRETELRSPDGKRLTVWFHPGRQKQGVNLNLEEGPVLEPHQACTLIIDGAWRSTTGTPIGDDVTFSFQSTDVDHEQPSTENVQIIGPSAGTRHALIVRFSEPMDSGMLPNAISLSPELEGQVSIHHGGREWHFTPDEPWNRAFVQVEIDPGLEDLAGNSFTAPFEVDVRSFTSPSSPKEPLRWRWSFIQ